MADLERRTGSDMSSMIEVEGLWFNNKLVWLDGYRFKHCRFDNCRIGTTTHHFILESCYIDRHSLVAPVGDISKVVKLANLPNLYQSSRYQATQHDDGTVTITAVDMG